MTNEPEEVVAVLVDPSQYIRHLNEVVSVTTRELVFLKRKCVSRSGHELVRYPLDAVSRVKHVDGRSYATLVWGVLLLAVVGVVLVALVASWDRLEPGTRVPVGAIARAGIYGARRVFGARRHRLTFAMRDGTKLRWTSAPGEHAPRRAAVENVVELARRREILESRLVRS